jgi:hypothetical protein
MIEELQGVDFVEGEEPVSGLRLALGDIWAGL